MQQKEINGRVFYAWNLFEEFQDSLTALLTTRTGGLDFSREEHRTLIAESLCLPDYRWALGKQVHGTKIVNASALSGIMTEECDGLETGGERIMAAVQLADCHPVIVYDPFRHRGIVAHAGWRGTAAGIAEAAVWKLRKTGSRPANLVAAAGPGIGACCCAVGPEVREEFHKHFSAPAEVFIQREEASGKKTLYLDIALANKARLLSGGIPEKNIALGGLCTACRPGEFHSYRKENKTSGRQAAILALH